MLLPDITERILRLRMMPILVDLPSSELAAVAATMRARVFQKGEVMLVEDEPPRAMFMVRTGAATMWRNGKRIGTIRGPGGVGFMSMLARNAGGTLTVADSRVEAYELRADGLDEIFEDNLPVLIRAVRLVAERLVAAMKDVDPPAFVPPQVSFDHLIGERELGIVERIFLLRRARAFAAANVNSLATLARRMTELRAPGGTVLWKPGDAADASFFVVKGMARLVWNEGATAQSVGPGYALGGAEALIGAPRWNTLVTDEPVVALRGEVGDLVNLFEDDHDLGLRFVSMMATYLIMIQNRKAEQGVATVGSGGPYESEEMPAASEARAP